MAKITFEQKWWMDPRREKLGELLGNARETEHVAGKAWLLAKEFWEQGELIPGYIWVNLYGGMELLTSHLACLHEAKQPLSARKRTPVPHISYDPGAENKGSAERESNGLRTHLSEIERSYVYVRGSQDYLSWGVQYRQQRVEAGRKSAEKRRLLDGTAQPKKGKKGDSSNETRTGVRTELNELEHTSTDPVTDSGSGTSTHTGTGFKKNKVGIRTDYPQHFDQCWIAYGRRGDKKTALHEYSMLKLSPDESSQLSKAIQNYVAGTEWTYRKHFCRFLKTDWREWLKDYSIMEYGSETGNRPKTKGELLQERNNAACEYTLRAMALEEATRGELQ